MVIESGSSASVLERIGANALKSGDRASVMSPIPVSYDSHAAGFVGRASGPMTESPMSESASLSASILDDEAANSNSTSAEFAVASLRHLSPIVISDNDLAGADVTDASRLQTTESSTTRTARHHGTLAAASDGFGSGQISQPSTLLSAPKDAAVQLEPTTASAPPPPANPVRSSARPPVSVTATATSAATETTGATTQRTPATHREATPGVSTLSDAAAVVGSGARSLPATLAPAGVYGSDPTTVPMVIGAFRTLSSVSQSTPPADVTGRRSAPADVAVLARPPMYDGVFAIPAAVDSSESAASSASVMAPRIVAASASEPLSAGALIPDPVPATPVIDLTLGDPVQDCAPIYLHGGPIMTPGRGPSHPIGCATISKAYKGTAERVLRRAPTKPSPVSSRLRSSAYLGSGTASRRPVGVTSPSISASAHSSRRPGFSGGPSSSPISAKTPPAAVDSSRRK